MAKKRKRRNYKGCGTTLLVAILLVILYIVALFLPVFNIKDIKVSGNSVLKSEAIVKECTIAKGQNILRISKGRAKRNILKMPYVKEVKIKRKLPGDVLITITEEVAEAYILKDKKYVAINEEGKVLEVVAKPRKGIMQIPGVKVLESEPGKIIKYKNENLYKLQESVLAQLRKVKLTEQVAKLDITNSLNIKITFNNSLVAEIGNSDELEYKIKMIETILGEGYSSGIFNISNVKQPTYRKNN